MKLMAGNSNLPLARDIAAYLDLTLTDASVRRFADEEVFVEIHENVRGEDVFVVQSTSFPANDNLMELLICIDALRRASAKRITAVVPYFGYARQDRKPGPRTPISAKLVANLITTAGADRVLAVDLHAGNRIRRQQHRPIQVGIIEQWQQLGRGTDPDRRFDHAADHGFQPELASLPQHS